MLLEGKSTEKAYERMEKLGMNPKQYSMAKTLLRNNGVSIYDFERLKDKSKRAGAGTFTDFLNMVKAANKEGISVDEYLDNKIVEGKSTFKKEVETNLSSTPEPKVQSELSKNIAAKAPEITKSAKNTPLPIAKRFYIDKIDKAVELLGNAVNSHARIINKKDVDTGSEPEYKRTQTDDFHLNSEPTQINIDGTIKTAYELTIGKGQRRPSKIGEGNQPGQVTNENDEDRIRAFYLKEGEKTYGRTENEEGRKTVIRNMNVKFFKEFLHSKFFEDNYGASTNYSDIPQEQLKKAYRKYMLAIIRSRVISPLYSKANNTYYVSQDVFNSLKNHIKTMSKPTNISKEEITKKPMVNTNSKGKSWMAEAIEDWNIKHKQWTKLQKAAKENGGIEVFKQSLLKKLNTTESKQEKERISQDLNLLSEKEPKKPNFNWIFRLLRQNGMHEASDINAFKASPEYEKYEQEKEEKNINPESQIGKKMFVEALLKYRKRIAIEKGKK